MKFLLHSLVLALVAATANAGESREQEIRFESGASSAVISGKITGSESVNYKLRTRAGQTMTIELKSDNASNYFNVYAPSSGPGDRAIYMGSVNGTRYTATLPKDGVYTIQVYLMRNAARRDESANYSFTVSVTDTAKPAGARWLRTLH